MDPLGSRSTILRRILASRWLRYPLYLYLLLVVLDIFLPEDEDTSETLESLYAKTNPWRELPADQETAVKEVLFIKETLRDTFLPTSVPDEDDYELMSKLVRSLETRDDISWTTLVETSVQDTISAIANRREASFAPEPLKLTDRFERLRWHWSRLQTEGGKPERWEVEHDTTFLPPLLKTKGLDGEGEVEPGWGLAAVLSDEQRVRMEERYAEWKKDRDRKVAYLKVHPPTPMAWSPVPTEQSARRAAWEEVMEDGVVDVGKQVDPRLVAASPKWRPIYGDLVLEIVPFEWKGEGDKEITSEEADLLVEKMKRGMELRTERIKKQNEVQRKLNAEKDNARFVRDEL